MSEGNNAGHLGGADGSASVSASAVYTEVVRACRFMAALNLLAALLAYTYLIQKPMASMPDFEPSSVVLATVSLNLLCVVVGVMWPVIHPRVGWQPLKFRVLLGAQAALMTAGIFGFIFSGV